MRRIARGSRKVRKRIDYAQSFRGPDPQRELDRGKVLGEAGKLVKWLALSSIIHWMIGGGK
jgi:hypothetical protein